MGSHKHAVSGHSGKNPKAKLMAAMDANRLADADRGRKPRPQYATSVADLMRRKV